MTATASPPRRSLTGVLGLFSLIASAGILAHGCHGTDVDHEPAVAVPIEAWADDDKRDVN